MFSYITHSAKSPYLLRTLSSTAKANNDSLDYCAQIVRQYDYENFMATLLLTKAIRFPALVVRAFNVQVARIQDQVTDSQTAAFRLNYWNDVIKKIYSNDLNTSNIANNPIAEELLKVCNSYKLPKRHFEKLIISRDNILKKKHFSTLEDIEKYADDTVSTLYYLILSAAGITNVHADHAASHLGKAQGITNILRSVHVSSRHKTVFYPMDILMKYNISQENILRGIDSESMRSATFDIASRANSHLEKARRIVIPKVVNQIFIPATGVDTYLKKLQKRNFNVFDESLQLRNGMLPLILYYKRLLRQY